MANAAMVGLAFVLDVNGSLTVRPAEAWQAVGGATLTAVVGAGLMACFMNPSHRRTFFMNLSLRVYIKEMWETRTVDPVGTG